MADDNDITLPKIPEGEGISAFINVPDPEKVTPDVGELLLGPDDPSVKSLLLGPTTPPLIVAGYAAAGEAGVRKVERNIRGWANELPNGKISKQDAYYFPETPIPYGAWEYRCKTCRFYNEGHGGQDPKCEVVGQEGDPFGGDDIHPSAWCILWAPVEGEGWFDFAAERLEGEYDGT